MKVTATSVTQSLVDNPELGRPMTGDELIVWEARVSSPQNQTRHMTGPQLINHCLTQKFPHWSIFDMADFTVEIETSMSISLQIIRHWSFRFQQYSQRYSDVRKLEITGSLLEPVLLRGKADGGNRQGSGESIDPNDHRQIAFEQSCLNSLATYIRLVEDDIAPESARFCLPLCTRTRLYMKGSVRSWIHYLNVRSDGHAQKEHREVAEAIIAEFTRLFPTVSAGVWFDHMSRDNS